MSEKISASATKLRKILTKINFQRQKKEKFLGIKTKNICKKFRTFVARKAFWQTHKNRKMHKYSPITAPAAICCGREKNRYKIYAPAARLKKGENK